MGNQVIVQWVVFFFFGIGYFVFVFNVWFGGKEGVEVGCVVVFEGQLVIYYNISYVGII